jgi:hypothetical protein
LITTSAPAWQSAIATALPMPEFAPVTRAFCPLRILRASHLGITKLARSSGIKSRTRALDIPVFVWAFGIVMVVIARSPEKAEAADSMPRHRVLSQMHLRGVSRTNFFVDVHRPRDLASRLTRQIQ